MNSYTLTKVECADLAKLKRKYLGQLAFPLDGMWKSFVGMADHYSILAEGEDVGYCAINAERKLLQFYVPGDHEAEQIFGQILAELNVTGAFLHSFEHQYLSLCMDHQESVTVNALQYHADKSAETEAVAFPAGAEFRLIEPAELQAAVDFAVAALGADAGWLSGYYSDLISGGKLFGLWLDGALIATGECRPSETQEPFADVGMVVSNDHRRQGLATNILRQLVQQCRERGLSPICSTERDNIAAQKAIEKSGLVSRQRILEVTFEAPSSE